MAQHSDLDKKEEKILRLLTETPEGLRVKTLLRFTRLPRRTLYRRLNNLKDKGYIKNIQPIWKLCHLSDVMEILAQLDKSSKNEQGHKIAWILPLVNKPQWWDKRKHRLMKLKEWAFKKEVTANNNTYYQIKNDYMQIQTYKNSIYFICQKEYHENSPLEVFEKAKNDVLEAIRYLEEQFRFKFIAENHFHLTLVDSHYVTLKDALAEQYKKEGKRFKIPVDGYFIWVDFSEPFGLESNNIEVKRKYLELIKDVVENRPPLPSEMYQIQSETGLHVNKMSKVVSKVIKNQKNQTQQISEFATALNKHIPAYEGMQNEVKKLNNIINELREEIKRLKDVK